MAARRGRAGGGSSDKPGAARPALLDTWHVEPRALRGYPRKTSEFVARQILADIVSRGLRPGDQLLPEAAMLEEYGVGRPSLREALRILEVHGLITIKPGPRGGPTVGGVDPAHFARTMTLYFQLANATFGHLMQARLLLEPVMCGLVAESRDPEAMRMLQESLDAAAGIDLSDDRKYSSVVADFHSVVASVSGNPVLDIVSRGLKEIFTDRVTTALNPSETREQVRRDHERIAKAIFSGNSRLAERLMREHLQQTWDLLQRRQPRLFDEQLIWE